MWDQAVAQWRDLHSDAGAVFDATVALDAGKYPSASDLG